MHPLPLSLAYNFSAPIFESSAADATSFNKLTLRKTWTEQSWDLFDENFRRKKGVIFLGELLDELLVLVELLQVLDGLVFELDELCAVDVGGIGENADAHARAGDVGKLDGTRETLVSLGLLDGVSKSEEECACAGAGACAFSDLRAMTIIR